MEFEPFNIKIHKNYPSLDNFMLVILNDNTKNILTIIYSSPLRYKNGDTILNGEGIIKELATIQHINTGSKNG